MDRKQSASPTIGFCNGCDQIAHTGGLCNDCVRALSVDTKSPAPTKKKFLDCGITLGTQQADYASIVHTGINVFFTGEAGSGKTTLLRKLRDDWEERDIVYAITAPTGHAATLIGGRTIHSFTGTGLGKRPSDEWPGIIKSKSSTSKQKDPKTGVVTESRYGPLWLWLVLKVLVIDEVSMCGAMYLTKLEYTARKLRNDERPWGGIQVVLFGDFRQLPPINDFWAFTADVWKTTIKGEYILDSNYRQGSDIRFRDLLRRGFKGELSEEDHKLLESRVVKWKPAHEGDVAPLRVYAYNKAVREHNDAMLENMNGDDRILMGVVHSSTDAKGYEQYPAIDTPAESSMWKMYKDLNLSHQLCLKIGAIVMLKVNGPPESGLVNGLRGRVVEFGTYVVKVLFDGHTEPTSVSPHRWIKGIICDTTSVDGDLVDSSDPRAKSWIVIIQYPLELSWATSINKCQGSTVRKLVVDAGRSVFATGMLMVALSRVRCLEDLFLLRYHRDACKVDRDVVGYYRGFERDSMEQ